MLAQYRCVNMCCVRVFQEELELTAPCAALRQYLFMLAGDFADAFVPTLMSQVNTSKLCTLRAFEES
jgi:predicted kinase